MSARNLGPMPVPRARNYLVCMTHATVAARNERLMAMFVHPSSTDCPGDGANAGSCRAGPGPAHQLGVNALSRRESGVPPVPALVRGGLAGWQCRLVTRHIEEHLAETLSLASLADLVGLSRYHFCRAFKQSFGVPPHHYHMERRIAHAKLLLANQATSVTEIGLDVGYGQTSAFSAAFRKATGSTPSHFRRALG
jgi:AraC-like DNA-binding protein